MANSGGSQQGATVLQYAQTPDGQQILVPSNQVVVQGGQIWLSRKNIGIVCLINLLSRHSRDCVFVVLPSGAGGELQTYQIRTASASSSLPQTVVTNSPVGLSQLKLDDPTMKREIRLAKNRQAGILGTVIVKVNFLKMFTSNTNLCWSSSIAVDLRGAELQQWTNSPYDSDFSVSVFQRGCPRVSTEEKRVREMSGKPRSRSGKPKQDSDRRVENIKGPLLRQNRMRMHRRGWWDDGSGTAQPFGHELGFWEHIISVWGPFFVLRLRIISCVFDRKKCKQEEIGHFFSPPTFLSSNIRLSSTTQLCWYQLTTLFSRKSPYYLFVATGKKSCHCLDKWKGG